MAAAATGAARSKRVNYQDFLNTKKVSVPISGFDVGEVNPLQFDFQADITRWGLRGGRRLIAPQCGMGKTLIQADMCHQIYKRTGKPTIIFAPLAVSQQTVREGQKFNIPIEYQRTPTEKKPPITVTNYERLQHFKPSEYICVAGDELGIIKNYTGVIRNTLIDSCQNVPYRYGFTATPCPNDYEEIGNHAEFLGICRRVDMLTRFFVHKGETTQSWSLKPHAENDFWDWLASWAVMIEKPSDLGYSDDGFILPPLNIHRHILPSENYRSDVLFSMPAQTLQEQRLVKRNSIGDRVDKTVSLVKGNAGRWIIWCELNSESKALRNALSDEDTVEVSGEMDFDEKEQKLEAFTTGKVRNIITKGKIGGWGLNWQTCHQQIFTNLSHSWEGFFQCVHRSLRFGQEHPVDAHIILTDAEGPILTNFQRKQGQAERMAEGIRKAIKKSWIKSQNTKARTTRSMSVTAAV